MLGIPETTGADLLAFGLLSFSLLFFAVLRLLRPHEASWRTGFRLGLWLALWQGLGLVVRMAGYA